jgi:hypothetical protein
MIDPIVAVEETHEEEERATNTEDMEALATLQLRLDVCQAINDLYMMCNRKVAAFLCAVVTRTQLRCGSCPTEVDLDKTVPSISIAWTQHNVTCQITHNDTIVVHYAPEQQTFLFSLRDGTLANNVADQIVLCIDKEKAIHHTLYETG